jgi:hypothetical protein
VAGRFATQLFAIGLLGASALAAAVVTLSTAYAISEAAGAERSVNFDSMLWQVPALSLTAPSCTRCSPGSTAASSNGSGRSTGGCGPTGP